MSEASTESQAATHPFRALWAPLRAAGWETLPLPPLAKAPPPRGSTGAQGEPIGQEALRRIADSETAFNIGIRPPFNVIGIDVDAYGSKQGQISLRDLEAKLGRLPLTVITSRRFPSDEVSGIRWYRISREIDNSNWPGVLGSGIELVRRGHRYGVAPGSKVHLDYATSSGPVLTYLALDQRTGDYSLFMPSVDLLPMLPESWERHLSQNASEPWAPLGPDAEWLTDGECRRVSEMVAKFKPATLNGSRHDSMRDTVAGVARMGAMGHRGTVMAIEYVRHEFLAALAGETRRDAEAEFRRAIDPLAAKLAGTQQEYCGGLKCGLVDDMSDVLDPPVETEPEATSPRVLQLLEKMRDRAKAQELFKQESFGKWEAVPILTLATLAAEDHRQGPDLIDGLIPEKGTVLLTAERKAGKTTLLLNAVKALVEEDTEFLGKATRKLKGNVLLLDLEMTAGMLQKWIGAMRIDDPAERFRVMPARGFIGQVFGILTGDYRRLAELMKSQGVEVLIIDPLAPLFAMLGWDEKDNSDIRRALTILSDFAKAAGASELILSHHTGKQTNGSFTARGASSFEDTPDNVWRLKRGDNGVRTFSTLGRIDDIEETVLNFNPQTGILSFGTNAAEHRDMNKKVEYQTMVLDYFDRHPEWISRTNLADELNVRGQSRKTFGACLDMMLGAGMLSERPRSGRGGGREIGRNSGQGSDD